MSKLRIPLLRAFKVADGFFAGSYPGSLDERTARQKIAAIIDLGVTLFINLMEEDEQHWRGLSIRGYQDLLPALGAGDRRLPRMERFPIPDMSVPPQTQMRVILDAIDVALGRGEVLYLHCLGGVGRTGTVVGCWLARHGYASGNAVFDELDRLRDFDPAVDLAAPQTAGQRRLVRGWRKGQ